MKQKKMNYKEFKQCFKRALSTQKLPCREKTGIARIEESPRWDKLMVGEIYIPITNVEVVPHFNTMPYFEEYKRGKNIEDIVQKIIDNDCGVTQALFNAYGKDFNNFQEVKQDIACLLACKSENNKEYIEKWVQSPMVNSDYVIVYVYNISKHKKKVIQITVSQAQLEAWNTSTEELREIAAHNMQDTVRYVNLDYSYDEEHPKIVFSEKPEGKEKILVSSERRFNGSYSILLPNVAEKIRAHYQDDFYVVPHHLNGMVVVPQKDCNLKELYRDLCEKNKVRAKRRITCPDDIYVVENGVLRSVIFPHVN